MAGMQTRCQGAFWPRERLSFTRVTEGRSSAIVRSWEEKRQQNSRFCMGLGIAQVWGEEARLPEHLFGPPGVKQNKKRSKKNNRARQLPCSIYLCASYSRPISWAKSIKP